MRRTLTSVVMASLLPSVAASALESRPPTPVPRPRALAPAAPSAPAAPAPAPVDTSRSTDPASTGSTLPHDPLEQITAYPREEQRRMLRRCSVAWTQKKHDGSATGMIWRDFLETCLPKK